jgi:phosphate transport system substrate-binding protein
VIGAIQKGNGTIGYADESQAGSLGKALIKVGDAFTAPTADAAANVLAESKRIEGRGDSSFAFDLDRTTTAVGTYPIVLVSYQIACSKYADAAQANLVKGFLTYTTSADGQQVAAKAAGSAPLTDELRQQITPAVTGISAGA